MKHYSETDMTMDEIGRALDRASLGGRVLGPLSRSEKASGGRIRLRRSGRDGKKFSVTHKAPGRYSAVPAVLRGRVYDGGVTRRIRWSVGKKPLRAALAGICIALMLASGVVRLQEGMYTSGAVLTIIALLLCLVAFLPSREEQELLRRDLYTLLRCRDEK